MLRASLACICTVGVMSASQQSIEVYDTTAISCCERRCVEQSNNEWAYRRADVHANCKLGCQSRNHGTNLGSCSSYCFSELNPTVSIIGEEAAGFSSQSECEESCLIRVHTNSSTPSQSSIASCTSWCTLDMPGMRLDCQRDCERGCQFFDHCTCPSGKYTSGSGCETCPVGFYCPIPFVSKNPCPPGRYGHTTALTELTCTGECDLGFYCPAASTHEHQQPCPAGTYGARKGLQDAACSGLCIQGHYCPSNSVSPVQYQCPAGRYGSSMGLTVEECDGLCEPGYYCPPGSTSATQVPCPAGFYGATAGLSDPSCDGPCPQGYFCPEASTHPTANICPMDSSDLSEEYDEAVYQCTTPHEGNY